MAIGFLVTLAILIVYKLADLIKSKDNKKELFIKVSALLLCISAILPPLAMAVPFSVAPTFNNGWKESLEWIKEETPKNAVITCWWDNGHIYTWTTRKMVTFDGGSQNTPRAYWVGRAFATSNENLSIGILRMLATSGDEAYKENGILWNYTKGNISKIVKILNEILPVKRSEAYKILTEKYKLKESDALKLLNYTHPEHPNPDYLITYNRMTDIAPVWSMFGFWNFSLPSNTPNEKREKGYFLKGICTVRGDIIVSNIKQNPYIYATLVNLSSGKVFSYVIYNNQPVGTINIHKVYIKSGDFVKVIEVNNSGEFSIFVRPDKGISWLSTRNLEDSIYAKLHFLDGYGLKHIKLVKASLDPTNFGIQPGFRVYEVDYGKEYLN